MLAALAVVETAVVEIPELLLRPNQEPMAWEVGAAVPGQVWGDKGALVWSLFATNLPLRVSPPQP